LLYVEAALVGVVNSAPGAADGVLQQRADAEQALADGDLGGHLFLDAIHNVLGTADGKTDIRFGFYMNGSPIYRDIKRLNFLRSRQ